MGGLGSGNYGRAAHMKFEELIDTSLGIQMRFFNDPNVPDEKKVEYASRYLSKRVGEKINIAIEHTLAPEQLDELKARVLALRAKENKIEYTADP